MAIIQQANSPINRTQKIVPQSQKEWCLAQPLYSLLASNGIYFIGDKKKYYGGI